MSRFPRRDERTGWAHVDVRLNANGTFDILTSFTLCPLGDLQGESVRGLKRTGITDKAEALRNAEALDTYLELQENRGTKKGEK
jgi:hypothetical protein